MDDVRDPALGISIRFIREWKPETFPTSWDRMTKMDQALALAMGDDRDIPMVQKIADALDFLRLRVH